MLLWRCWASAQSLVCGMRQEDLSVMESWHEGLSVSLSGYLNRLVPPHAFLVTHPLNYRSLHFSSVPKWDAAAFRGAIARTISTGRIDSSLQRRSIPRL